MSVRFEKESIVHKSVDSAKKAVEDVSQSVDDALTRAPLPGTSGKHPVAEAVGTALTGGKKNAGTKGYLQLYFRQMQTNPLRTKMLTAGLLASLQELLASWIAKDRNRHGHYFTSRVPKMALYGSLISAPMGHFFVWILQKIFRGRTSLRAKVMQILISNFIIAPIQNSVYLTAMALIAGARTIHQIRATVRVGFWKVMKISWVSSPLCLAFAQKFLPYQLWVPFFNVVAFSIGTYINAMTKKKRLAALRKKHFGDREARDPRDVRDIRDTRDSRDVGRDFSRDRRDVRDSRESRDAPRALRDREHVDSRSQIGDFPSQSANVPVMSGNPNY